MRSLLLLTCVLVLAACGGRSESGEQQGFDSRRQVLMAMYAQSEPGCKSQAAQVGDTSYESTVCVRSVLFRPNQYLVDVNGRMIFVGDRYTDAGFFGSVDGQAVVGACVAALRLVDSATMTNVPVSELSTALVDGCGIAADDRGLSMNFLQNAACDAVLSGEVSPMSGAVMPIEDERVCTLSVAGNEIFSQRYAFE